MRAAGRVIAIILFVCLSRDYAEGPLPEIHE